jgi:two-component system chemotaxis response regulator CheB
MAKKILVVDDSALIRKELGRLLTGEGFEVETAKNGQEALDKVLENDFDAITLDINMPVMDGLTALKQIMKKKPTPTVMVSSLTQGDADTTFEALDYGAVDFVGKPGTITLRLNETAHDIVAKVKAAAYMPKNRLKIRKAGNIIKSDLNKPPVKKTAQRFSKADKVILIGSSTGGPGLIEKIVTLVPADYPYPICIIQHMPDTFTRKFAQRLDGLSSLNVIEAKSNDVICQGKIIIGKGGYHFQFSKKASGTVNVKLGINSAKRFFVPSVDEMFLSASQSFKCENIMAIELTGIGDDGAQGMLELKNKGAYTIAESKETATIYGMPRAAYENGGTVEVLPFPDILKKILSFAGK